MVLDDAVADAEAEAGASRRAFGRKERIEHLVLGFRINAGACIGENHFYVVVRLLHRDVELSPVRHGVARVQDQVEKDLLYLVRVYGERRNVFNSGLYLNLFEVPVVPDKVKRVVQNTVEAGRDPLPRIEPCKVAEAAHNPRYPLHVLIDGHKRALDERGVVFCNELLDKGRYGGEGVPDLMRYAGGKPPDARVLGSPEQFLLDLLFLGNVFKHEDVAPVNTGESADMPRHDEGRIEVPPAGERPFPYPG